jgi:hypothetical protein
MIIVDNYLFLNISHEQRTVVGAIGVTGKNASSLSSRNLVMVKIRTVHSPSPGETYRNRDYQQDVQMTPEGPQGIVNQGLPCKHRCSS